MELETRRDPASTRTGSMGRFVASARTETAEIAHKLIKSRGISELKGAI
jgi:hypothetical protein